MTMIVNDWPKSLMMTDILVAIPEWVTHSRLLGACNKNQMTDAILI
jgi:hypothetical protein